MEHSKICEWEIIDQIGILRLNNPPQNKLTEPQFVELEQLKKWTAEPALKGMIMTGRGRNFSTGADLDQLFKNLNQPEDFAQEVAKGNQILQYIENLNIPVLSIIQLGCFGGGLELALASHIRVCSSNAYFAFPEANLHLMPGLGGCFRLTRLLGEAKALKMILSSDMINAEQALAIGLVDYVQPKKEAFQFGFDLMKKMTSNRDLKVIRAVVQAVNNSRRMSFNEAIKEETRLFCQLALSEARQRQIGQ